jgi:hypothetical protein
MPDHSQPLLQTMKCVFPLIFLSATFVRAQDAIDWNQNYKLQLSDFQSPISKIGGDSYKLDTGSEIEFYYHLSEKEFMKLKNFNPKVNCRFKRTTAALVAPDSVTALNLVNFSQYDFDLSELYARKLRKKLYMEKASYSNINFFKQIFEDIQKELTDRRTNAGNETELGRDKKRLKQLHSEVLKEMEALPTFCKTCDPSKKKKK